MFIIISTICNTLKIKDKYLFHYLMSTLVRLQGGKHAWQIMSEWCFLEKKMEGMIDCIAEGVAHVGNISTLKGKS